MLRVLLEFITQNLKDTIDSSSIISNYRRGLRPDPSVILLDAHYQDGQHLHRRHHQLLPLEPWPGANSSADRQRVSKRFRGDRQSRQPGGDRQTTEDEAPRLQRAFHGRIAPKSGAFLAGRVCQSLPRKRAAQDMLLPFHPRVLHRAWGVSFSQSLREKLLNLLIKHMMDRLNESKFIFI